jgi:hypothetical protein
MGKPPLELGAREALVTRVACHPRQEMVAIGYADETHPVNSLVSERAELSEYVTVREHA